MLYTTILMPFGLKPMSFENAFIDWQGFAGLWLVMSLPILLPVALAAIKYPGSRKLFSFNRCYPLKSLILWISYGSLATLSIIVALTNEHLYQAPKVVSSLLFAYLYLLCNAAVINKENGVAPITKD